MSKRDFLIEIGTEELPPKTLFSLAAAFADGLVRELAGASVTHGDVQWFATPRRLAVFIRGTADRQPDQEVKRLGPSLASAFDTSGQPTRAALGFAASCGTTIDALQHVDGPKGRVLQYVGCKAGERTAVLLPQFVVASLRALPIAKRMRWGAGEEEFVRPVHWAVMLFGADVIETEILGVRTGRHSRGHRFHAPRAIAIRTPAKYCQTLLEKGFVIADASVRRERIRAGVEELARNLGGIAVIDPALLDEVASLVEWPVPLAGRFDPSYLELPQEVPIATMQDHQRYFPVRDPQGNLMNHFITVANIESKDPDKVRDGNERVVRPRLADAAFFWKQDRECSLESRRESLKSVTFQQQLGSLFDKSQRTARLAVSIAQELEVDPAIAQRAAELSKCDLLTAMVGEFPELQGTMGKYYAMHDGEAAEVCAALEEQYLPRYAGDHLPDTSTGKVLALADKLDTISGIFCIGQKPSGTRDPYGLRRAALGVLRISVESKLELDLRKLIDVAVELQPTQGAAEVAGDIWNYLMERLRSAYLENGEITTEMFDAVLSASPTSPLDIESRLRALSQFLKLPESESLANANKRIANLLRKASAETAPHVEQALLQDTVERELFDHLTTIEAAVNPVFASGHYESGLTQLAALKDNVDRFFDSVMVMVENPKVRANRLALLTQVRGLFMRVADLSKLPG